MCIWRSWKAAKCKRKFRNIEYSVVGRDPQASSSPGSMWDQTQNHGITSACSDHLNAELDPRCYF